MAPYSARRCQHVLQVGRTIFVRWRADRDELHLPMRNARRDIRGEMQAAGLDVALHQRFEARFVDGNFPAFQLRDFSGVDVETHHVVAHFRQACARYEPDVAGAYDGYFHAFCLPAISALMAASAATGSGACVTGRPITR